MWGTIHECDLSAQIECNSPYFVYMFVEICAESGRAVMNAGSVRCAGEARRSACRSYLPDECTACVFRLTMASPFGLSAI